LYRQYSSDQTRAAYGDTQESAILTLAAQIIGTNKREVRSYYI